MYTFLFDRRSMTLFVTGLLTVGLLLFGAGVLVGMRIALPPAPARVADFEPLSEFESPPAEREAAAGLSDRLPKAPAELPKELPAAAPVELPQAPAVELPAPAATAEEKEPAPEEIDPIRNGRAVERPQAAATPPATRSRPLPERPAPPPAPPAEPVRAPARDPAPPPAPAPDPIPAAAPIPAAGPVRAAEAKAPAAGFAGPQPSGIFFVQVGAYRVQENAERHLAALLAEGFNAYLQPLERSGGTLQAVRFGRFATREVADQAASRYLARAPGREALVQPPR